ncbi:ATP-dependent Clp protease ATP-binding subunit [Candidatus Saccharibacteria bacterium]|nr:ATP-dependent Clp protease ATP-binding subunit [Candidatus Saccharibacteria bacterium]
MSSIQSITSLNDFGGATDQSVLAIFRRALQLRALFSALKYDEEGALLLAIMWQVDSPAHKFLAARKVTLVALTKAISIASCDLATAPEPSPTMPTGYVRFLKDCLEDYDGMLLTSEMLLSYVLSRRRAQDILRLIQVDPFPLEQELEKRFEQGLSIRERPSHISNSSTPPFLAPFLIEFHSNPQDSPQPTSKAADTSAFLVDLVELAKKGRFSPLISRDIEVDRLTTILARRTKNNPLLLGEAGVGKTAIVEGLAHRIADNSAPIFFQDKVIYQVDMTAMLAGASYRGQFEKRLQDVVKKLEADPNAIAFIDELHTIVGAGDSEAATDAANILKPALARGNLSVIGATTHAEFSRSIARDKALLRRFQTIYVSEPDTAATLAILRGVAPYYADFHKVKVDDSLLARIVDLSNTHIFEGRFPDKALDLLDEAAARAKVNGDYSKLIQQVTKYDKEIKEWQTKAKMVTAETPPAHQVSAKANISRLRQAKARLEKKLTALSPLTEQHVLQALSARTKVPLEKLGSREKTALTELESSLNQHLIGQSHVISEVSEVIRRAKSGLASPKRPLGSFIFTGPTGVGKTELAKVLAREIFGGEQYLIRFDMSEFSESASSAKLLGSPAGYIGYQDETGFDRIRQNPHSVVLFDEIEKAHPSVWNIFLQILEDGHVKTARGEAINFHNTIIIMTSNLNSRSGSGAPIGFSTAETAIGREAAKAAPTEKATASAKLLSKKIKPELIGRFDKILEFKLLTHNDAAQIFDLFFNELADRLKPQNIKLSITPEVRDRLINLGFSSQYGAREMRRVIERELEAPLALRLLGQEKPTPRIKVCLEGSRITCR